MDQVTMNQATVRAVEGEERMFISLTFSLGEGEERSFNFDRPFNELVGRTLTRMKTNFDKSMAKKRKKKKTEDVGGEIVVELYDGEERVRDDEVNGNTWRDGSQLRINATRYIIRVNPPTVKSLILPEVIMAGFTIHPKIETEFVNVDQSTTVWYVEDKSTSDPTQNSQTQNEDKNLEHSPQISEAIISGNCHENGYLEHVHSSCAAAKISGNQNENGSECTEEIPTSFVGAKVSGNSDENDTFENEQRNCVAAKISGNSHENELESTGNSPTRKEAGSEEGCMVETGWREVGRGRVFTPGVGEVGLRMKLLYSPWDGDRHGDDVEVLSTLVKPSPGKCLFEDRQNLTKNFTQNGCFRIVCYNVLADLYADTHYARQLKFPHCPRYALQLDYRKQILIKELIGYHGDIVCLQEVDIRLYNSDLQPILGSVGYEGRHKAKIDSSEGEAIFWRKEKFRFIEEHNLHLSEALQTDPACRHLYEKISDKKGLSDKVMERKTILQVCVLESVEEPHDLVLVATSHLYFYPTADHVRLVQMWLILHHITTVRDLYTLKMGVDPAVVFCGDLNSTPHTGLNELIVTGHLPAHHADWYSGGRFEHVEASLDHSLKLHCASGTPPYTTYVPTFAECIDYIYICDRLEVSQTIPLPSHCDILHHTALPSPLSPSDHLALVCDITWT